MNAKQGITANPIQENNLFEWEAAIRGPDDSHWEGGVFRVELIFPIDYDLKPPKVYFSTVPFHPNVDMQTGRPCVDFLDDQEQWRPEYDITYILMSLQHMLPNPVLENPVNPIATHAYENAQSTYIQFVHECVAASRRIQLGLPPYEEDQQMQASPHPPPMDDHPGRRRSHNQHHHTSNKEATPARKSAKISYDDYFSLWRGVATSKSHMRDRDVSRGLLTDNSKRAALHDSEVERKVDRHIKIVYGANPFDRSAMKETIVLKRENSAWMRDFYTGGNPLLTNMNMGMSVPGASSTAAPTGFLPPLSIGQNSLVSQGYAAPPPNGRVGHAGTDGGIYVPVAAPVPDSYTGFGYVDDSAAAMYAYPPQSGPPPAHAQNMHERRPSRGSANASPSPSQTHSQSQSRQNSAPSRAREGQQGRESPVVLSRHGSGVQMAAVVGGEGVRIPGPHAALSQTSLAGDVYYATGSAVDVAGSIASQSVASTFDRASMVGVDAPNPSAADFGIDGSDGGPYAPGMESLSVGGLSYARPDSQLSEVSGQSESRQSYVQGRRSVTPLGDGDWENQVDDLVTWTADLDTGGI